MTTPHMKIVKLDLDNIAVPLSRLSGLFMWNSSIHVIPQSISQGKEVPPLIDD